MNKLFVAVLILLALSIVAYQYLGQRGLTLRFSKLQLEERLQQHLPYRKKALAILEFELSQPEVTFLAAEERISVAMQISLEVASKVRREGLVSVSGVPSYRPSEGAFYLSKSRIDQLSFEGLSSKYSDMASNAITGVVRTLYDNKPLYTLDPQQTRQKLTKLVLQEIAVSEAHLIVMLGAPGD